MPDSTDTTTARPMSQEEARAFDQDWEALRHEFFSNPHRVTFAIDPADAFRAGWEGGRRFESR